MEGESLLKRLKDGSHLENLLSDVQDYLAPVCKRKAIFSDEAAYKYGLTALKMLRACVQTISSLTLGSQHLASVTSIAHVCYKCIKAAQGQMKIVPLSLEKVLFHIMLQLVNKSLLMDALSFADHLYVELRNSRPKYESADGVDNEFDTIAKQAFNQLWKACAQIEESSKTGARHILVLNARRHALALLMLTNQETSGVSERALRAALEMERYAGKDPACSKHLHKFFSDLVSGVLGTLDRKHAKSKLESGLAKALGPVMELCLQLAKYLIMTNNKEGAIEMLAKAKSYAADSKVQSQSASKLICAIIDIIHVTISLSELQSHSNHKASGGKSKTVKPGPSLPGICERLCHACDALAKCVETSDVESVLYQVIVDTNELLRKQLEGVIRKGQIDSLTELCHTGYWTLVAHLDVLEAYKEHLLRAYPRATDVYRGLSVMNFTSRLVQKQLATLDFLASLTIRELNAMKTDPRPERTKEEFGSRALAICKRTKAVIEDVSKGAGGAISVNEHRWLGSNSFNLGLICYKKAWYGFAWTLLQLACEQFQRWCSTDETINTTKAEEIQLATKYELLVDCQRRAGHHRDAMTTVAVSLLVIPGLVIGDITSRAEQWVKSKRDALKAVDDPELRNRTILDECQEIESDLSDEQLSTIASALNEELKVYKTQRHDTFVEQYSVIQDLLRFYAGEDYALERARACIQLARLVYSSDLDIECPAEEHCTKAVEILESLPEGTGTAHMDLLAQAKFWLYLTQLEACIQNSTSSTSTDLNVDLSQEESTAIDVAGDDTASVTCTLSQEARLMEHLQAALDTWASLLQGEEPGSSFDDPASTLQCLQVAADIMAASGKPLEEIRVLSMLSKLAHTTSSFVQAVESDLHLSKLLAQSGVTCHASLVITRAEGMLPDITGSQRDMLVSEVTLAKCLVLLYSGKVEEFEKTFSDYLNQASRTTGHRSCRTYLRSALAKELHWVYISLPASLRSSQCSRLTRDEHGDDLSPLDLVTEAMRLRIGVAKIFMGTDMNESNDRTDSDAGQQSKTRWRVLGCVLHSFSQVAQVFCQQGCIREAQCYITEGMSLAQKFQLPRRYGRFLQQLVEVLIKWGQEEECQSALSNLKTVIVADKQQNQPKPSRTKAQKSGKGSKQKGKSKQKLAPSRSEESDEEDFIRTQPLSLSSSLAGRNSEDMSNSPNLKRTSAAEAKFPDYVKHCQGCTCDHCMDISRHELDVAYLLSCVGFSALTCNYVEAATTLKVTKKLLEWSQGRHHQVLGRALSLLGQHEHSSLTWTPHLSDFGKMLSAQAEIEVEMDRPDSAICTVEEGLALFEPHPASPALHSIAASFHYCMAVAKIQKEEGAIVESSWALLQRNLDTNSENVTEVDDVARSLTSLKLEDSSKINSALKEDGPACRLFQGMLDTSSARPEVTRQRDSRGSNDGAVLPEELGLFSDVVLDDTDTLQEPVPVKKKPDRSKGRSKSTVQVTKKKGAINYKVAKKNDVDVSAQSSTTVDDSDVFIFDEESTTKDKKKSAKGRGKRGCPKQISTTIVESNDNVSSHNDRDITQGDSESDMTAKVASRSKVRGGPKKKPASQVPSSMNSNKELLQMVDEVMADFSDTASTKTDETADAKPKRGRGRRAKDSSADTAQKEIKPRGRRARIPKGASELCEVEQTRGIPDPDPAGPFQISLDDSIEDILPVDSSTVSSSSPSIPQSPPNFDFSFEESQSILLPENVNACAIKGVKVPRGSSSSASESSVLYPLPISDDQSLTSLSFPEVAVDLDKSSSMLLTNSQEEFNDIEVPRAGSDSEDTSTRGRKRGKGARKNTAKTKTKAEKQVLGNAETSGNHCKDIDNRDSRTSRAGTKTSNIANGTPGDTSEIACIQEHLEQAYNLIKHLSPTPLYRHICQLLALCQGDRNPTESGCYLAQAPSVTLRHQKLASLNKKLRKLRKASEKEDDGLLSAMGALSLHQSPKEEEERLRQAKKIFSHGVQGSEMNIIKDVTDAIPKDYTVCQLSVVSTKPSHINSLTASTQLIMTKLQRGCEPLVVRLPTTGGERILECFEKILAESKGAVRETDKKIWWTTRQRLDDEMQNLTVDLENDLLGCWKGLVAGSYSDQKANSKLRGLGKRLLQSLPVSSRKEEQASLCECLIDSHQYLNYQQINSALFDLSGHRPGTEALTQLSATLRDLAKEWQTARSDHRNPVILILDTPIQQLPWESMPVLKGWPVCRLPSLHFLLSHLRASDSAASVLRRGVDPKRASFVLNPTGDLLNTQKTFQEWFQTENEWKGVVGRAPNKPEYTSALTDHDLFVFCGHGTGREFLTGDDIQRLTCRAATLLIGCSSGKLQVNGCLDASGMALNYLLAECPCVVANLWDVTDRDIDRFLEYLLKAWLATSTKSTPTASKSQSLASLLNDARQACKLKHLIGYAPVIYGLPVTMKEG